MTKAEQEQKSKEIQTFRYGVIAELANPYLLQGEKISLIKEKASREYQIPYSNKTTIGPDCIRKWLSKYRKYGIEGLLPKIRNDSGKSRSISPEDKDTIIAGLESDPYLTATAVVKKLGNEGKITSDDVELSYGGIPLKPLPRTYGDRLVVVGTAAGQVKPTTGGGIYYGLLCADIAANNLHRALKADDLSGRKLAGYERGWKRKLGRELKTGYWARRFYELLNDRQVDRMLDIIESNGILETLLRAEDLSFDWHGGVVQRVIRHGVLIKAIEAMKIPFRPPS